MIAQSYTEHTHTHVLRSPVLWCNTASPPTRRSKGKRNKLPLLNKEKVPTQSSAPNALNKRKATAAECNDVIFSSFFIPPQILFRGNWYGCCCWFLFMMISAAPFWFFFVLDRSYCWWVVHRNVACRMDLPPSCLSRSLILSLFIPIGRISLYIFI